MRVYKHIPTDPDSTTLLEDDPPEWETAALDAADNPPDDATDDWCDDELEPALLPAAETGRGNGGWIFNKETIKEIAKKLQFFPGGG